MGDILRKTRAGKFVGWYVRYKDVDGRRKTRATHQPSKELARRYLVEIEARIARGRVGLPVPTAASMTVSELCARFLADYSRPRIKDLAKYRANAARALRRALPYLGKRPASELTPAEVSRVRDTLVHKCAPASVRVCLAYLAAAYSWAAKHGLVPSNPLRDVERPRAACSLDFYSRQDVEALLRVAAERATAGAYSDELLLCCAHLAVHTGLRKGELLGLRWQDLDLDTQRLTVARSFQSTTKNNQLRHLRLPSACVPVLGRWRELCPVSPADLVFPIGSKTLDEWTPRLLTAAGVRAPAHPWHAMRHTFASHFIMAGGNILSLQRILGHSDVKMTLIYAHLAPDFLGQEMERVSFGGLALPGRPGYRGCRTPSR